MKLNLILILFVVALGIFLIFSNQIVNPPNQPTNSPKNKRTSNFQSTSPKNIFKRDRETYDFQRKSHRKELIAQSAVIIQEKDDNQAEKENGDQAENDLELSTDFYEDTLAQQTEDSSIARSTLPEGVGSRILIDGKYYDIKYDQDYTFEVFKPGSDNPRPMTEYEKELIERLIEERRDPNVSIERKIEIHAQIDAILAETSKPRIHKITIRTTRIE